MAKYQAITKTNSRLTTAINAQGLDHLPGVLLDDAFGVERGNGTDGFVIVMKRHQALVVALAIHRYLVEHFLRTQRHLAPHCSSPDSGTRANCRH